MKLRKILSVILAALMFIVPINLTDMNASAQDYGGSNVNAHNYYLNEYYSRYNWANPTKSYLTTADGGFMRVQAGAVDGSVVVQYFDSGFNFKSEKLVSYGLPLFGAFYETEDNYYLLSGQNNPNEDDSVEVYRVTKFDKSWNKLGEVGLYGENTYMPFDGGSASMTHKGKYLVVRTCHEMYLHTDGYHHQANVTFEINTSTMKVTDKVTEVLSTKYGYVSHSFNQFVKIDGNNIVGVDHGDAYPRSVVLIKYSSDMSYGQFFENLSWNAACTPIDMLPISGGTGNNYTGVEVGGFEISDSSYIVVGDTIDQSRFGESDLPRNIFISTIDKNLQNEPTITYLTNYNDDTASNPFLVKVNENSFFVVWEHNGSICYRQIDGSGNSVGKEYQFAGQLSDCQPIVYDGRVIWYVWNSSVKFHEFPVLNVPKLSGLKASAGNSNINLSWDKNSSASYYMVFALNNGDLSCLEITENNSVLSYTANSLSPNTTYNFRVAAFDSSGNVIAYSDISAKTAAEMSNLKITPGKTTAKLSWDKNTSAAYYRVYAVKNGTFTQLTQTANNSVLSYTATGLNPSATYSYRVIAFDSSNVSIASSDISTKTLSNIGNLTVSPGKTTAKLTWAKNPNATNYKLSILKNGAYTTLKSTTGSTLTATELVPSANYTLRISAFDASGAIIGYSDITTKTLSNIGNLTVSPGKTTAKLTWAKNPNATNYKLSILKNGAYTTLKTTTGSTLTATELVPSANYTLRISAFNASGAMIGYSDITTRTLSNIGNLTVSPGKTTAKLTWAKNPNATNYKLSILKNGAYTTLKTTTGNTLTATELVPSANYTLRISAFNASGAMIGYSDITTKTLSNIGNLTVSPGKTTAKLTWAKNPNAANYKLSILKNGAYTTLKTTTGSTLTATGLVPSANYTLRISAFNASGAMIGYSDITTKTLSNIGNLTVTPYKNSATLRWSKNPNATSYSVLIQKDGVYTTYAKTTGGLYTVSGLNANTSYNLRVSAYDASGKMIGYSDISTKTTSA